MMKDEDAVKELLLGGLIRWYDMEDNLRVLCINVCKQIVNIISEKTSFITEIFGDYEVSLDNIIKKENIEYDLIIVYDMFDYFPNIREILFKAKCCLSNQGRLLIFDKNRLAIRRFCGSTENISKYTMADYRRILSKVGFDSVKFYSVFPRLEDAQLIYSEHYYPSESMQVRYIPKYANKDNIFFCENRICDELVDNKVLHQFANAYAIECSLDGKHSEILNASLSIERGQKRAMITILYHDRVVKKAVFNNSNESLKKLYYNQEYLRNRNISVVKCELKDGCLIMPYVDYPIASNYLSDLAKTDKDKLIDRLDQFYELICNSSEIVETNHLGPILKKGFVDLVPLNCFWTGSEYLVFDQEYCQDNVPARMMMLRTIIILYEKVLRSEAVVTDTFLYDRYGITENMEELSKMERAFINGLRASEAVLEYNRKYTIGVGDIENNFNRIFGE